MEQVRFFYSQFRISWNFWKKYLKFIRPKLNSIYNIYNPLGINILRDQELALDIQNNKGLDNFQDSINPMCNCGNGGNCGNCGNCGNGAETTIHYFIYCAKFNLQRQSLFDNVGNVDETLLFGKQNSENSVNKARLNLTIQYILSSKRFNCPLF